jgi:2-methylisocitrate lyase-like PEP mutase family enzyme
MSLTNWWMEATEMSDHVALASRSLALHRGERPLLLPNPWDQGSAVLLAWLGFQALATTSSGFAATLGRLDGAVRLAAEAGLAGCSVEDFTGHPDTPIYEPSLAAARIEAAAEAAHRGPVGLVLTARAENHLHGRPDLADTIDRLQAYQQAGADVLYAPGLTRLEDIRQLVASVDRPVNVLARRGVPPVAQLADVGVRRVSVGGGFAFAALGALVEAATELLEDGTYGFWERAAIGSKTTRSAFPT